MTKFIINTKKELCVWQQEKWYFDSKRPNTENNFDKAVVIADKTIANNRLNNFNIIIRFIISNKGQTVSTQVTKQLTLIDKGDYYMSEEFTIGSDILKGIGQVIIDVIFLSQNITGITNPVFVPIFDVYTGKTEEVAPLINIGIKDVIVDDKSTKVEDYSQLHTISGDYDAEDNPLATKHDIIMGAATDIIVDGVSIVDEQNEAHINTTGGYDELENRFVLEDELNRQINPISEDVAQLQSDVLNINDDIDTIEQNQAIDEQAISGIQALIPEQATTQNQLADKGFVNSSVATNTAYFKGTFESVEELPTEDVTNNDYAFVDTVDEEGNRVFERYKYNSNTEQWAYEYTLNNSSFTAEQWETINSGITQEQITAILQSLSEKANDNSVVHKTGSEVINGLKTFKSSSYESNIKIGSLSDNRFIDFNMNDASLDEVINFHVSGNTYSVSYKGFKTIGNKYLEVPTLTKNEVIATQSYVQEQIAAITDYENQQF